MDYRNSEREVHFMENAAKKPRKGLVALITILIIVAFIVVAVMITNASAPYNDGTFVYTPLENKTYSVALKDKSVKEIEIPTKDKNYKKPITVVTGFSSETLEEVVIPEGITTIQSNAFSGCTALTKVELPESLKSIGSGAFENCTSLKNITLPSALKTLSGEAFMGCTELRKIEIPETVTKFYGSCFAGCTKLESIVFHGTIAQVEEMNLAHFWPEDLHIRTIICSDGTYTVPTE